MRNTSSDDGMPTGGAAMLWFGVRVIVLLLGLLQAQYFMTSLSGDYSKPSWKFAIVMTCAVTFGMLFIFFIQSSNPQAAPRWYKPSWFRNPFDYKQPLQLFHLGAFYFLMTGAGCFLLGISHSEVKWLWELPAVIGCSFWLGVRLCVIVFRDKFQ